jgi:hypothetical protein
MSSARKNAALHGHLLHAGGPSMRGRRRVRNDGCAAAMGRSAENDNHLATGFVGLHDVMRFADFLEPKYSRRLGFQEA